MINISACGRFGDREERAATETRARAGGSGLLVVVGGELTMVVYSEATDFDPIIDIASGTLGGHELMAIYDSLARDNTETGEYEPRMLESFEPNDDHSHWRLEIRPGIRFSDGTAFDAEAVKFGMATRDPRTE